MEIPFLGGIENSGHAAAPLMGRAPTVIIITIIIDSDSDRDSDSDSDNDNGNNDN